MTASHSALIAAAVILNAAVFLLYGWDKICAKRGKWRIPERTLLLGAFLGGSIGAMLGMFCLRHKTRHLKFVILVPLSLAVHAALVLWLALR